MRHTLQRDVVLIGILFTFSFIVYAEVLSLRVFQSVTKIRLSTSKNVSTLKSGPESDICLTREVVQCPSTCTYSRPLSPYH